MANTLTIRRYLNDRVRFSYSDNKEWKGFVCKTPCILEQVFSKSGLAIKSLDGNVIEVFDYSELIEIIDENGTTYTPTDIDNAFDLILEHIIFLK